MFNIGEVRIGAKGQIELPSGMRIGLKKGDKLVVIKDNDKWIIRNIDGMSGKMKEDIEFALRTEEAWQSLQRGEGIRVSYEKLFEEMDKW